MQRLPCLSAVIYLSAASASTGLQAQTTEQGRVISSTPVIQSVAVPQQTCYDQLVPSRSSNSGAGALMGGIAGGAMGNAIGDGNGRAAATVLGVIGGAILGDRIEGSGQPQSQIQRQCSTQTVYQNQVVAYQVVYEYAGRQYHMQMPQDPGPTVALQVLPIGVTSGVTSNTTPGVASTLPPQQIMLPAAPVSIYYPPRVHAPPVQRPPVTLSFSYRYDNGPAPHRRPQHRSDRRPMPGQGGGGYGGWRY